MCTRTAYGVIRRRTHGQAEQFQRATNARSLMTPHHGHGDERQTLLTVQCAKLSRATRGYWAGWQRASRMRLPASSTPAHRYTRCSRTRSIPARSRGLGMKADRASNFSCIRGRYAYAIDALEARCKGAGRSSGSLTTHRKACLYARGTARRKGVAQLRARFRCLSLSRDTRAGR